AGLAAGVSDARNMDVATRRHAWEVWTMLLYVFNGLVFLLLGVQLQSVIIGIHQANALGLTLLALTVAAAVVVLRLAGFSPLLVSRRRRAREGIYQPRHVFLIGWAGIRGAVPLAAALSIPLLTASGEPFPGRDLIIFLAGSVIVITLALHGLTLP